MTNEDASGEELLTMKIFFTIAWDIIIKSVLWNLCDCFCVFRSRRAHSVRFGYETKSTSTTSVWRWLPTWRPATNSTSALSGGVQITAVRFQSAVKTFNGTKLWLHQTGTQPKQCNHKIWWNTFIGTVRDSLDFFRLQVYSKPSCNWCIHTCGLS